MDPFNDKASHFDRRSSLRRSLRLSNGGILDEEEEYDLAAAAVSDGFRPTHPTPSFPPSHSRSTSQSPSHPQPFASTADTITTPPKALRSMADRPLSISKPPRAHDSLTLRNDGSHTGQLLASDSASTSDAPQIRPQSPYRGPTGPSHPYQMYPQRSLSIATTSTAAPAIQTSYDGPRAPAHPYALYTQNVPEGDDAPQQHIPVGFAGAGDAYRRQIGPDGEEAGGLIGPLGHTEELPPYTRYPDESSAPKTSVEPSHGSHASHTTSSPQLSIPGAGGIGVATRNPEFSATEEDLDLTRSRPSTASQHDINTAARTAAEKPQMNKWQRRAKKKLWGIVPYWAICLLIVGVLLLGVILGAVIGTVFSSHKGPGPRPGPDGDGDGDDPINPSPTPIADIIPLQSVPADLPPLSTGSFWLPQLIASQAPKSCFNETTQSQAWSCDMPFHFYTMGIAMAPSQVGTDCYSLNLTAVNANNARFLWGAQPPDIPHPRPLTLVNDTFEPRRGPAWWLKMSYDKTVLIPESSFSAKTKRFNPSADLEIARRGKPSIEAQNGDKPWICTWPDVSLEIFIYPKQNASLASQSTTTTNAPMPTASATNASNSGYYPYMPLQVYPKVVKFLERRISQNHPKAYCRQVQVIDNGQNMVNMTDSSGNPIEVEIIENVSTWQEQMAQHQRNRHVDTRGLYNPPTFVAREAYELTQCGCLWWST